MRSLISIYFEYEIKINFSGISPYPTPEYQRL